MDYGAIRQVKKSVNIPVIASGNILSPELAKMMFDETGCDGISVARGAMGNPWIFKHIAEYMNIGHLPDAITKNKKIDMLNRHLSYIDKYRNTTESGKIGSMRKIATWYLRGFPEAAKMRQNCCRAQSYKDIIKLIGTC